MESYGYTSDKRSPSEDLYSPNYLKVLRIFLKNCLDKAFEEFELPLFAPNSQNCSDNVFSVLIS